VSRLRPLGFVIAAGGCGFEASSVTEPTMTKTIKLGLANVQPLCSRQTVKLARVESRQNFLNKERWDTMDQLFFSRCWKIV